MPPSACWPVRPDRACWRVRPDKIVRVIAATTAPVQQQAFTSLPRRFEQGGIVALFGVAASVQFSIAIAQSLLAVAALCWLGLLVTGRERVQAPRFFWLLAAYAGATLVSAALSSNPRLSLIDCKQ